MNFLKVRWFPLIRTFFFFSGSSAHPGGLEKGILGSSRDQRRGCSFLHLVWQREDPAVGHHRGGERRGWEKEEHVLLHINMHSFKDVLNPQQRRCFRAPPLWIKIIGIYATFTQNCMKSVRTRIVWSRIIKMLWFLQHFFINNKNMFVFWEPGEHLMHLYNNSKNRFRIIERFLYIQIWRWAYLVSWRKMAVCWDSSGWMLSFHYRQEDKFALK